MQRGTVPGVTSHSQHVFSKAPQAGIPRSKFNRSFSHKTVFDEGYLIPILADEMLPGDTFALRMHAFARIATLLFPIMDNLYMETFFFFVPNRLVWEHWEQFCGMQVNPGDPTDYTIPQVNITDEIATGDIYDYFGIPLGPYNFYVNALHFRAYNLIYNDWFRDQNLQDSVEVDTGDGPDGQSEYALLQRGKRKDYFISCLPFPQKGPPVSLPLGTTAPIDIVTGLNTPGIFNLASSDAPYSLGGTITADSTTGNLDIHMGIAPGYYDPNGTLVANLSGASAADINDIRMAFQLQKYYEKNARGGTRYTEVIKSHFNVVAPDMRLQRSEYIGGGSTPVLINPVAQTAPTSGSNPLAQLGAYGVAAPTGHGFTYSATEHGVIVGLVMVRADINYQSGLDRMWSRQVFTDYYWPVFSHIGEQAVLNQEIYLQGSSADTDVFGYQERYAEYRYKPSLVTGAFRSKASSSLDAWHLAQDFGDTLPVLNSSFIVEAAPMSRIEAVSGEDGYDFLFDAFFDYHCARPIPIYSVPGLVDHF